VAERKGVSGKPNLRKKMGNEVSGRVFERVPISVKAVSFTHSDIVEKGVNKLRGKLPSVVHSKKKVDRGTTLTKRVDAVH